MKTEQQIIIEEVATKETPAKGILAAAETLKDVVIVCKRNNVSLASHCFYAPKGKTAMAELRKEILLLKRHYSGTQHFSLAIQISAIEELGSEIEGAFPCDSKKLLEALDKLFFKIKSDLSVELAMSENDNETRSSHFLPEEIIEMKHGIYRKILWEINTCYSQQCSNACAAMIRRLIEGLIIESFEKHGLADSIKLNGDYLELNALIGKATAEPALKLTRNTKRILPTLKFFGDASVHNRRMLIRQQDIDKFHQETRAAIEELARNLD